MFTLVRNLDKTILSKIDHLQFTQSETESSLTNTKEFDCCMIISNYLAMCEIPKPSETTFPQEYILRLQQIAHLIPATFCQVFEETRCLSTSHDDRCRYHFLSFVNNEFKYEVLEDTDNISSYKEWNIMRIPKQMLHTFFSGHVHWDEISYSRFYTVRQSSNGYYPILIQALRCLHNLQLFDSFVAHSSAKIGVLELNYYDSKRGHTKKMIKRYCPHQGFDLLAVEPTPEGIIVCPMHGHRFDINTGRCVFGDRNSNILAH